jgi:amino-acid N-acetyltransferase
MMVLPQFRNQGIATALVAKIEQLAGELEMQSIYLITNTAESYFALRGFEKITNDQLPSTVAKSEEFNGLCPASSIIMKKNIAPV